VGPRLPLYHAGRARAGRHDALPEPAPDSTQPDRLELVGDPNFIGLRNFVGFFQLPASWRVLYVTLLFLLWDVVVCFGVGLAVALALNQRIRFRGFFRAAVLIPWTVTAVVAG